MITGFAPLDFMIMESSEKTDKIIVCIRENSKEIVPFALAKLVQEMKINIYEDLTGNDLIRVNTELKKKGYSLVKPI